MGRPVQVTGQPGSLGCTNLGFAVECGRNPELWEHFYRAHDVDGIGNRSGKLFGSSYLTSIFPAETRSTTKQPC